MPLTLLLLVQAAGAAYLTGLVWFVQVVHYPLMAKVGPQRYADYQAAHQSLTSMVVGPPMLIEAFVALFLFLSHRTQLTAIGLLLVATIWASTFFLQIPQHNILGLGFDADAHNRLVVSNWIRTVAWTVRTLLAFYMLSEVR